MNSERPIKHIRWAILCSVVGLALTGCADTPYRPAPITSVKDGSSNNTVSNTPTMNSGATPVERSSATPLQSAPPSSIKTNSSPSNINTSQPQNRPVQNTTMPRNVATNDSGRIVYNRNYDAIPKGNYDGNTYTVKRGDTMFYIAWITDSDVTELAAMNNIPEPYSLNVGQVLNIGNRQVNTGTNTNVNKSVINTSSSAGVQTAQTKPKTNIADGPLITKPTTTPKTTTPPPTTSTTTTTPVPTKTATTGKWLWPAQGKIIENYSSAPGGNKGIDIGGTKGSPIVATAAGKVVYAGSALRGYGNLVIIKHNDEYLSAYAHNDTILVREQQNVNAGQQIATMGSTGTSSVRLHFEIRYKEKSLNPMSYLPKK
ncbi:murein hydrolase activator NlpD [Proteus myxofaciens]|uniref:NlpD family lipoprotein n=1 Tax=Proteus myxofaciens ATCC 19692 TaxID=1354337 RepID=A0A198GCU6_9GAMM|nr:murein hydrolase activator NlpD [Proteus myxofaciens]OAT34609.1 NlpD family lipoprotein [Proteus myxofaciens ATCC 19692]